MSRSRSSAGNGQCVILRSVTPAFATAATEPTITLVVDGQSSKIHSAAHTVGDVLASAGYTVASHDIVAPAVASSIEAGDKIVADPRHKDAYRQARKMAFEGKAKIEPPLQAMAA